MNTKNPSRWLLSPGVALSVLFILSTSMQVATALANKHCTYEGGSGSRDLNGKIDSCFGPPRQYSGEGCTAIDLATGYYCTSCSSESCNCSPGSDVTGYIYVGTCVLNPGEGDFCFCLYSGPPFEYPFPSCSP